jgi:hypothetical protein
MAAGGDNPVRWNCLCCPIQSDFPRIFTDEPEANIRAGARQLGHCGAWPVLRPRDGCRIRSVQSRCWRTNLTARSLNPSSRWVNPIPTILTIALAILAFSAPLPAQPVPLQAIVNPSSVLENKGKPVAFALHGFIEFKSLSEVFSYIDSQKQRWKGKLSDQERDRLGQDLLREAIESRIISMVDERPLEALVTHTSEELKQAIAGLTEPVPSGYGADFSAVQDKWKHSLNCWSAASSISARVLSNWYPIEEGIKLHGAVYDSTEHFWQAVKYHPDTTVADVTALLDLLQHKDWAPFLARLDDDPKLYLPNAYAVEFLRYNLAAERLRWFRDELNRQGMKPGDHARQAQQRDPQRPAGAPFRFSAPEDKALWGDLADVLQMIYILAPADDPVRKALAERHFDGIYLDGRKLGFISEEFRAQMLEIWRVKYLQMPRFREVISSIPMEIALSHFLNDGDSPDIPIPIYVGYLNEIRKLARGSSRTVSP